MHDELSFADELANNGRNDHQKRECKMRFFGRVSVMAIVLFSGFTSTSFAQTTQRERDEKAKKEEEEKEKTRAKKQAELKVLRNELAKQLKFEVELPDDPVPWKRMNSTRFKFNIKVTNPTQYPAVIAPFFSVKLLDSDGEEFKPKNRTDRYGPLTAKEKKNKTCRLDSIEFITVPPGKSRLLPSGLVSYDFDPKYKVGYKFVGAGSYRVILTHEFSHERFLKLCLLEDCENHDDEKKPWNRACELKRTFEGKLKVSE